MLIKLYNGLNRFAPGLRLNFRYFSWVPGHRSPTITMADLLPFFDLPPSFFLSLFLFLSFSLSLLLFSFRIRFYSTLSHWRLCSSPANPLILRDMDTHVRPILVPRLVDRSRHICERTLSTFLAILRFTSRAPIPPWWLSVLCSPEEMQKL